MKLTQFTLIIGSSLMLLACSTLEQGSTTSHSKPAAGAESVSPASVHTPTSVENKPSASAKELEDEVQRLSSMQKNYFSIFKIDETNAGLKGRQNAIGVFDLQKTPRGERLRLTVTQLPKAPVRLSVGTYTVVLDTVVDYVETRVCKSASCAGKQKRIVRSLPKLCQIQISPMNQYLGTKEISLAELTNAEGSDSNYKSTYADVVITIKRITVLAASTPQT
jgi:hypothetical protein